MIELILTFCWSTFLVACILGLACSLLGLTDLPDAMQAESNLIGVGIWSVSSLIAALYTRRRWLKMQAPLTPICANCGYDLRGTTSNRCSECGHPVAEDYVDTFTQPDE